MDKIFLFAIVVACFASLAINLDETPFDNAVNSTQETKAKAAAYMVKVNGYHCDSISNFIVSDGYIIKCNDHLHTYEVKCNGEKWTVTLK